jgi:ribosome-binding protein aMBF1 (putative translation factor)
MKCKKCGEKIEGIPLYIDAIKVCEKCFWKIKMENKNKTKK